MSNENTFSLNNQWSIGKTKWARLPLPEHVFQQACVIPFPAMLDPHIGTETILCIIDPTDFIHELSAVKPFQLFISMGLIKTNYGPVVYVLYHVPNPNSPEPVVILEQTLNPFDAKMLAPYHDLARQSHWHVFLVDGAGNEVSWFEFENNFRAASSLAFSYICFQSIRFLPKLSSIVKTLGLSSQLSPTNLPFLKLSSILRTLPFPPAYESEQNKRISMNKTANLHRTVGVIRHLLIFFYFTPFQPFFNQ